MAFWSVNPYVGCEFGCAYCYARDTHRWTVERAAGHADASGALREAAGLAPALAFERRILVKEGVSEVLARTLDPSRLHGHPVVIGTATDPYQPAERQFRLTHRLLQTLLEWRGLHIGVITKSPLIARDADLLAELAHRHRVSVHISLLSLDAGLLRRLEPRTPVPAARLRAVTRLAGAGVPVGLLIAPILPGLSDSVASLRSLMVAAKDAGARWAAGDPLRMNTPTRRLLLPWLEREHPDLAERYARHYRQGANVSRPYAAAVRDRLRRLQHEVGFEPRPGVGRDHDRARAAAQLELWAGCNGSRRQ